MDLEKIQKDLCYKYDEGEIVIEIRSTLIYFILHDGYGNTIASIYHNDLYFGIEKLLQKAKENRR